MRAANIISAISALAWLTFALTGMDGVSGVAERVGGPDLVQVELYVVWPLFVVLAIIATAWVCNAVQRFAWVQAIVSGVTLVVLLPYCAVLSGGA